ncbi:GNAT family N-acetyltransferase [Chitinimonas lacunae]|uniref:GNAT family N-acetyltransferase n=1 Tax=Chitinimonas lacunae TaxID=1963018 RepID=A0ABV8MP04_9NEIS
MVVLRAMQENDFRRYLDAAVVDYATDKLKAGVWSKEEALEKARSEHRALLPQGLATPDHYLFNLYAEEEQTEVGMLWFGICEQGGQREAFVYDIAIDPKWRRMGYATQAFLALEQRVRQMGLDAIGLHVFGHNKGAFALYEKLGYVPTSMKMKKSLGDGNP